MASTESQNADLFLFINEHREECDREPFKELTPAEIEHHMDLIDKNAPYGQDPWSGETICTVPTKEQVKQVKRSAKR
jgi:hypothetical protein